MKIAPINNNYSNYGNHNCNTVKNPNFKGIWGKELYENTYNDGWSSAYECDMISTIREITYYPFADEPKSQIYEEVNKKREELKNTDICVGWIPLRVTAKQYAEKLQEVTAQLIKDAEHAEEMATLGKNGQRISSKLIKKLK